MRAVTHIYRQAPRATLMPDVEVFSARSRRPKPPSLGPVNAGSGFEHDAVC